MSFSNKNWLHRFLTVTVQLILLTVVIHYFNIEKETGLPGLLPFAIVAFVINALVPIRYRQYVLLGFFLFTACYLFGFDGALLVTSIAVIIIGIAQISVVIWVRVIMLGVVFFVLALALVNRIDFGIYAALVPVVASIFMFRLILYMYENKNNTTPKQGLHRLSYFLMFPNLFFLLFPIVDYKTYVSSYYKGEDIKIYQKGIRFIFWGVLHIIAYRLIYHHCVPLRIEVHNVLSLAMLLSSIYMVVLHLSGMFHIAIGLLCLFGYDLPRVFNLYFLIPSFREIWRRINVYWRDFIMKVFYTPIFLRIKKIGLARAIFICTLFMFVITWALHNYQLFWLSATLKFNSTDIAYWMILGVFITIDIYLSVNNKKLNPSKNKWISSFRWGISVVGIFIFMCVTWSYWTFGNFSEWQFVVVNAAVNSEIHHWMGLALIVCLLLFAATSIKRYWNENWLSKVKQVWVTVPVLLLLLAIYTLNDLEQLPLEIGSLVEATTSTRQNKADRFEREHGYYDEALINRFGVGNPFELTVQPKRLVELRNGTTYEVDNLLVRQMVADTSATFKGMVFTTNSFAIRDKEYTLEKPDRVMRIILLGGSYELGSGVGQNENYESVVEDIWNERNEKGVEILNFSGGGYHLIQALFNLENRAIQFSPDAILLAVHTEEDYRLLRSIALIVKKEKNLKYDFLIDIIERSGVNSQMPKTEIMCLLQPFIHDIQRGVFGALAQLCSENNIQKIMLYLPTTEDELDINERERIFNLAKDNNFELIDLSNVYNNFDLGDLAISIWDTHPNEKGHQLIADSLYAKLNTLLK